LPGAFTAAPGYVVMPLPSLRTLMLNGGWERYWQQREVLPLLAS